MTDREVLRKALRLIKSQGREVSTAELTAAIGSQRSNVVDSLTRPALSGKLGRTEHGPGKATQWGKPAESEQPKPRRDDPLLG